MRFHPGRRRAVAVAVAVPALAAVWASVTMGFAHLTRTHVIVRVADNDEIVQVFVNCRFAASYADDRATTNLKDLGWLEGGNIVTVQIRGWRADGSYSASIDNGSVVDRMSDPGAANHGAPILTDRLIHEMSMNASGIRLPPAGCQPDSRSRLPLAASATGRWSGAGGAYALAGGLTPIVGWALALIGLLALAGMGIRDVFTYRGRITFAKAVFLIEAAVVAQGAVSRDFGLALALCQIVGACWIAVVLYRLLIDDLVTLGARWLRRHTGGDAGTAGTNGPAVSGAGS